MPSLISIMAHPAQRGCPDHTRRGPSRDWGYDGGRVFRARSLTEGGDVAWVLRLVEIGAEGEGSCADVVEISRPDGRWCKNAVPGLERGGGGAIWGHSQ